MGGAIGEALANALTLIDSPIVIGGGLSNAIDLFGPQMMKVMRRPYKTKSGKSLSRLCVSPYLITDENEKKEFFGLKEKRINVPDSKKVLFYNETKAIPIMLSSLGANHSISLGAVRFANSKLEKSHKDALLASRVFDIISTSTLKGMC